MTLKRFPFYDLSGCSCVTLVQMKSRKIAHEKVKGARLPSVWIPIFQCAMVGFSLIFVLFLVDITVLLFLRAPHRLWRWPFHHDHSKCEMVFYFRSPSFRFNIKRHEMCHKCNKYYLVEWACKLTYFFFFGWVDGGYMTFGVCWLTPCRVRIDTFYTFQMAAGEHTYLVSHSGRAQSLSIDVALAPPKNFSLAIAFDFFFILVFSPLLGPRLALIFVSHGKIAAAQFEPGPILFFWCRQPS